MVSRRLEGLVRKACVIKSPLNFQRFIDDPNSVVHRSAESAKLLTPSLHQFSPHESIQIVDNHNEQLFVYMRNGLHEAWDHPNPVHPDCTWDHMHAIVHDALHKMAETYEPNPKPDDKQYDVTD